MARVRSGLTVRATRSAPKAGDRGARLRQGFSLLETMMALTVLAVGVLATTAGQLSALKQSADSRHNMLAMNLAEQQMEIFRLMDASDVTDLMTAAEYPDDPSNPIDPEPSDNAKMKFYRRWIIEPDTPEPGIIRITLEVDWTNSLGMVRTARIQSLKASS